MQQNFGFDSQSRQFIFNISPVLTVLLSNKISPNQILATAQKTCNVINLYALTNAIHTQLLIILTRLVFELT